MLYILDFPCISPTIKEDLIYKYCRCKSFNTINVIHLLQLLRGISCFLASAFSIHSLPILSSTTSDSTIQLQGMDKRNVCSTNEEFELVNVLDELIEVGWTCENSVFRLGYIKQVLEKLPNKQQFQVEMKIKTLKKHYYKIKGALNNPQFNWNGDKHVLEEPNQVWEAHEDTGYLIEMPIP